MKIRAVRWRLAGVSAVALVVVLAATLVTTNATGPAPTAQAPSLPMNTQRIAQAPSTLRPAVAASMTKSLNVAPVALGLVVEIPSIGVHSHLLGVGMTAAHAMAAPEGNATSPYWGDTFWYRGGAVPGSVGTATIAGHIDDIFGRYAVFGRLSSLVRGERIIIHNSKTGVSEHFEVTAVHVFSLAQARTTKVLNLIYGVGPPQGRVAQRSRDGLAHLSLITCTGSWDAKLGTHNERLVVSAVRVS